MFKTKEMLVRESDVPYVDSTNTFNGTCNPLKHFFCLHGIDALSSYVVDAVGGVKTSGSAGTGGLTTTGSYFTIIENNNTIQGTGGSFETLAATESQLVVVSGFPDASSSGFIHYEQGDSASAGFQIGSSGAGTLGILYADDAAGAVDNGNFGASVTDQISTFIFPLDKTDTTGNAYEYGTSKTATTACSLANQDYSAIAAATTYGTNYSMRGNFYGIAVFNFVSGEFPADWLAWSCWMGQQWQQGNFVFPPVWSQKT